MGRLQGKTAIVTGAASGLGRATAELFAAEGARVCAADVSEEIGAAAAQMSGEVMAVRVDVSDESQVANLIASCVERWGGLDVLHANAGVVGPLESVLDISVAGWRRVLDVNLIGTFVCLQRAAKVMVERGRGSIVCTASVAGLRSGAGPTPYSASKAALISVVQTAAWQLSGTGVRVNAVAPGLVETGMTRSVFAAAREAGKEHKIGQLNPTRRPGEPSEIARAVLFLASDDSSYVNGQVLAVDGGLSASHPVVPGRMM